MKDKRTQLIDILEPYSMWLTKNGYMDTDWKDEEPFAIDEYLKTIPKESKEAEKEVNVAGSIKTPATGSIQTGITPKHKLKVRSTKEFIRDMKENINIIELNDLLQKWEIR